MTAAGSEFRLGIIGGCMSHQPGIPMNQLYHRRLARLLAADPGVRLKVEIARSFESGYPDRLRELRGSGPLDGVLIHVRVTAASRSGLLVRVRRDGRPRRVPNPALLRRGHRPDLAWEQPWGGDGANGRAAATGAASPDWNEPQGRRIAGLRLGTINYMLGALAGLDRWAVQDEMLRLVELDRACRQSGLPLFVLGPTPAPIGWWYGRMVARLNAALRDRTARLGLPLALIGPAGDAQGAGGGLTLGDGIHLSRDGHMAVAEALYHGGMRDWVRDIAGGRP